MKKSMITCLLLLLSGVVFSQTLNTPKSLNDLEKQKDLTNKLRNSLSNANGTNSAPEIVYVEKQQKDPGVMRIPLKGKFIGNNKAGADIYAMLPYKMPCLVPDSTFAANMPVKKSKIIGAEKTPRPRMKSQFSW
jgi:hypothetical protein